eukprot:3039819-Prymnesium_polylepis.1
MQLASNVPLLHFQSFTGMAVICASQSAACIKTQWILTLGCMHGQVDIVILLRQLSLQMLRNSIHVTTTTRPLAPPPGGPSRGPRHAISEDLIDYRLSCVCVIT